MRVFRTSPDDALESLRRALEATCAWPAEYTFKFVVPRASATHLTAVLDGLPFTERPSRTGKFVAFTVCARMESSDAVIALYRKASRVERLIAFCE